MNIELASATTLSPFLPSTQVQWAWDSTCLGLLKTCPRLYYYTIIMGWVGKDENIHLRFGQEFHKATQDYAILRSAGAKHDPAQMETVEDTIVRTDGWKVDVATPTGKYKNRESLIRTIVNYLDHYERDPAPVHMLKDGTPAVELSFRFELDWGPKLPGTDNIAGDQPYTLCGHLDRVVDFNGGLFVMDHKTTKSSLTDYYFIQYEPNNQMTLYTLASRVILDAPIKGVIIDAVQLLLEPPYNAFVRRLTYRTPDQLDEWTYDLEYWLNLAESFAEAGYWPMNDMSCDKYGGCRFREVCSKSPQARDAFLRGGFVQLLPEDRWNPLKPR